MHWGHKIFLYCIKISRSTDVIFKRIFSYIQAKFYHFAIDWYSNLTSTYATAPMTLAMWDSIKSVSGYFGSAYNL